MNRDDIITMARKSGFVSAEFWPDAFQGLFVCVERFAALVAAHEREACATVAESVVKKQHKHINGGKPFEDHMHWEDIAAAIRSRSKTED